MIWLAVLISVLFVSLISLVGVFALSTKEKTIKRNSALLVSFAAGALFGDAIIHLLPEAFEELGTSLSTSLYVISGIVVFFVLEKFLHWRHCHLGLTERHTHSLATMNLVGDGVHNFIDGLLIGATYLVSFPVGLATTLAIIFHEIPQEIGDFGVLLHAGLSVKKALLFNFLSALLAVLGAVMALLLNQYLVGFEAFLLAIAAGGFLYIAGSDLIPELKHECGGMKSVRQFVLMIFGIAVMALLTFLE